MCKLGELIYTCKMIQLSRFSQPVLFSRFKPDNLRLSTARFSGYNLEKCTGWLNLEKCQVGPFYRYRLIPQVFQNSTHNLKRNSWLPLLKIILWTIPQREFPRNQKATIWRRWLPFQPCSITTSVLFAFAMPAEWYLSPTRKVVFNNK